MTIAVAFLANNSVPIIVSDSLVTESDPGTYAPLPYHHNSHNLLMTDGFKQVGHFRKIEVLNENFVMFWSGDCTVDDHGQQIKDVFRNILTIVDTFDREVAVRRLVEFFEQDENLEGLQITVIAAFKSDNGNTFKYFSNCKINQTPRLTTVAAGSGAGVMLNQDFFHEVEKKNAQEGDKENWITSSAADMLIRACLSRQLTDNNFKEYRFGGFYEVVVYEKEWRRINLTMGSFLKIDDYQLAPLVITKCLSVGNRSVAMVFTFRDLIEKNMGLKALVPFSSVFQDRALDGEFDISQEVRAPPEFLDYIIMYKDNYQAFKVGSTKLGLVTTSRAKHGHICSFTYEMSEFLFSLANDK